jgi:hypothetical protein
LLLDLPARGGVEQLRLLTSRGVSRTLYPSATYRNPTVL